MLTIVKSLLNTAPAEGFTRRIGSASEYLKRLANALGTAELSSHLGIDQKALKSAIREKRNQLTWFDDANATPKATMKAGGSDGASATVKGTLLAKGEGEYKLTEGSILDFDCIVTTARRDRDGDVLEPKGALIDPKMPLLWQHIPFQPVGRQTRILEQNENVVASRCMIASTPLGNDAAILVDAGCLRISHGFSPINYNPLKDDQGKDLGGWHIEKYAMMEVSLVSIPSNVDAEITASSRGKFHSPLMKAWGKLLEKNRTKMYPTGGAVPAQGPLEVKFTIDVTGLPGSKAKGKKADDDEEDDDEEDEEDKAEDSATDTADASDEGGDEGEGKGVRVLGELIDAVREMAKDGTLPKEAQRRFAVVDGILEDIEEGIGGSADAISEAAKNRDLAAMFASMGELVSVCGTSLKGVVEEVSRIASIEGISDSAMKGCTEISEDAQRIVEAVCTMSGQANDAVEDGDGDELDPTEDEAADMEDEDGEENGETPPEEEGADLADDGSEEDDDNEESGDTPPEKEGEEDDDAEDETDDDKESDDDEDDDDSKSDDDEDEKDADEDDQEEKDADDDDEKDADDDGPELDPDADELDPDEENPGAPKSATAATDKLLGRHIRGEKLGSATVAALKAIYGSDLVSGEGKSRRKSRR